MSIPKFVTFTSVSYTHLDVYKRQVVDFQAAFFAAMTLDGIETRTYYDDMASVYCDMAVTGVGRMSCGAEAAADIRLSYRWLLSLAASAGRYEYIRDPRVTVLSDVDNSAVDVQAVSRMGGCETDVYKRQAVEFFENIPNIYQKLRAIQEVGLGYLTLGQPCTTLSGGESQRIKLSSELSKRDTGRTLYILDEPTTGLHFEDIRLLLEVLNKLVDRGNTVIVIEHNLDVIKVADHIIDIGPEGGAAGGEIIVAGTPHEVAQCEGSYTGQFLKKLGL